MTDCCTGAEGKDSPPRQCRCPVNGNEYGAVHLKTILHHIRQPWTVPVVNQGYYFCSDPQCDVVYFGQDGIVFPKSSLRTKVGIKENGTEQMVCYCFGVTKQEAEQERAKADSLHRQIEILGLKVEELQVGYDDGVVTVRGNTPTQEEKEKIDELEKSVEDTVSKLENLGDETKRDVLKSLEERARAAEELAKEGMRLTMPLAPRANKSILANLLERVPAVIPRQQWSALDPLRCTEIVWGDGNILRTGDAANWTSMEAAFERKQSAAGSGGPGQTDFYRFVSAAQGSMGIVTWISLKCRFLSELSRHFLIPSDSLESLIELSYCLTRIRFTGNIFILNGVNLACLMSQNLQEIASLRDSLPAWVMFVSCEGYGPLPEEKVQYLETDLRELAGSYGLNVNAEISGINAEGLVYPAQSRIVIPPARLIFPPLVQHVHVSVADGVGFLVRISEFPV